MGTNYYLTNTYCKCCERVKEENSDAGDLDLERLIETPNVKLHIGKSSGGWCFSLHVIPELGLNTYDDWMALIDRSKTSLKYEWTIVNEYRTEISKSELHKIITQRVGIFDGNKHRELNEFEKCHRDRYFPNLSDEQYHRRSVGYPIEVPIIWYKDSLIRHYFDGVHCVGHGEGSWDYITGEFS